MVLPLVDGCVMKSRHEEYAYYKFQEGQIQCDCAVGAGKINRIDKCIPKMTLWSPLLHDYCFLLHAPFLFKKSLLLAPGLLFSCSLLLFYFWLCSLLLSVSEGMLLAPGLPLTGVQISILGGGNMLDLTHIWFLHALMLTICWSVA